MEENEFFPGTPGGFPHERLAVDFVSALLYARRSDYGSNDPKILVENTLYQFEKKNINKIPEKYLIEASKVIKAYNQGLYDLAKRIMLENVTDDSISQ